MADIRDTTGSALAWLRTSRGTSSVLAAGLSVLAAATTTVVLRSADPASADTRVVHAHLAQVYLPDGSNHPAEEGEVLPRGAELHTGAGGGAQLVTAGRRTWLDGLSTLAVVDGVRERLVRGNALVDARGGARVALTLPAGSLAVPSGSAARVEEGTPLTRIGVYAGSATLTPVDRSSANGVPALEQVLVQPGSLPQRATALQLRGDSWDRDVAADLVAADDDLNRLAAGLAAGEGRTVLATVRASYSPSAGAALGEQALTFLVAKAAHVDDALADVRQYRAELGSWGVVAALVQAPVADVSALLSATLTPVAATDPGAPTTVNAGPPVLLPTLAPTAAPSGSTPTSRPTTTPTRPRTTPTATPTQSADPGLVQSVVKTVTDLLPHPTSSPAAPARPTAPSPTPKGPCLLGAVLC